MEMDPSQEYNTYVGSAEEAISLAQSWKEEGRFDLFRGQGRNWPILASMHRVKGQGEYQKHRERFELLHAFMSANPVLDRYIENPDHIIAIAQHHGIATNFIDFTSDPEIAGYFATNSTSNKTGEMACIICANRLDFKEIMVFGEEMLRKNYTNGHGPEFLSIDVENLWRLQAQKGLFLYTPFSGIEQVYRFDRILFPYSSPLNGKSEAEIYPSEKSILETHLDYYFESERRSNNMTRIIDWLGEDKVSYVPKHEIFDYLHKGCKPHYSWKTKRLLEWNRKVVENWEDISNGSSLDIFLPYKEINDWDFENLARMIKQRLLEFSSSRNKIKNLKFFRVKRQFDRKTDYRINVGANLMWNGMRVLPYSMDEIAISLARFVVMFCAGTGWERTGKFRPLMGQTVEVGLEGPDGSHTRSFVGGSNILNAKRRNIYSCILEEHREICRNNPVALVQLVNDPRFLFTFEGFKMLFVMDVIPSQTIRDLGGNNPIIYFNPAQVEIFGLA